MAISAPIRTPSIIDHQWVLTCSSPSTTNLGGLTVSSFSSYIIIFFITHYSIFWQGLLSQRPIPLAHHKCPLVRVWSKMCNKCVRIISTTVRNCCRTYWSCNSLTFHHLGPTRYRMARGATQWRSTLSRFSREFSHWNAASRSWQWGSGVCFCEADRCPKIVIGDKLSMSRSG